MWEICYVNWVLPDYLSTAKWDEFPCTYTSGSWDVLPNTAFVYRVRQKSVPYYRHYTEPSKDFFAFKTAQKFTHFKKHKHQLSACRAQSIVLPKRKSVSPHFATSQCKLSTMSQNRSNWSGPCSAPLAQNM